MNLSLTEQRIKEVAELIYKSEKPIIYAGQGCNNCPGIIDTFIKVSKIEL